MRMRGFLCLAAAALLAACDGPTAPAVLAQTLTVEGRRVIGNGDLFQPRFTNGGPNSFLTVTGLGEDGFETVFVLNAITIDFEVVSRADTVLNQATGLDIEFPPNDDSFGGTPSQEGAFAAYLSEATNLLEARFTTFERQHVYLRDVYGEANELISVGSAPLPGNESRILLPDTRPIPEANDHTSSAVLSGDGRFVVFATRATNIVPLAKNGLSQIYVYDGVFRSMELITRVAIGADVFPGNGHSVAPFIATTGRFVVYQSDASNLILGDTNNGRDIFVFNRSSRETERLNIAPKARDDQDTLFDPGPPIISEDGNAVVFSARPTPLGVRQIYVRHRATGATTLISTSRADDPDGGNADSRAPALDQGGRFVVFQSDASNLVPSDDNDLTDIFVYDIRSGRMPNGHSIKRVNVNVNREDADGESLTPTISPDGALIAFVSRALNLVAPTEGEPFPPNRTLDLYLFDNPLPP